MTILPAKFPPFVHVQPTKENIPFVELGVIDLSQFVDGPEGLDARKALAAELEEAVRTQGFFFITNHGFPKEKIDNLLAISQVILDLPQEEKVKYLAGSLRSDEDGFGDPKKLGGERGAGFKPKKYWAMQRGVRDNIEHFNWRDLLHPELMHEHNYPPIVHEHLDEVAEYYRYLHFNVLRKLCVLFDIILEVEDGTTWKLLDVVENDRENSAGGFARAMLYHGMTAEDEEKTEGTWLRGHSDGSALTFITSQPMASLQFRDYHDGQWKYVGYKPNALVVNVGDLLEFLTGSYFKSTIHRVVGPPADQRGHRRLGLIYFCDTKPNVYVDPETLDSPKLKRLGYTRPPEWEKITTRQWADYKGKSFGKSVVNGNEGDEPKPFYIAGRLAERWHQKVQ